MKRLAALAAPVARKAWRLVGRKPGLGTVSSTTAGDLRGLPLREVERWTL